MYAKWEDVNGRKILVDPMLALGHSFPIVQLVMSL